ncbi:MAG TPA: S8 family peptidase [Frankiaceae bacterium]|nr:S8 family peptidase [Frankiaceae bacterium]
MRSGRFLAVAVAAAAMLGPAALAQPAPAGQASAPVSRVIVQSRHDVAAAAAAVRAAGGTVTRDLPVVAGVAADVPAGAVARLAADARVRAVTPDSVVTVSASADGGGTNTSTIKSVYRDEVGASVLAAQGTKGAGVRIALVDTGVNEVPDLAGRIVPVQDPGNTPAPFRGTVRCVDFSGEGDCVDRYGHGTFLAGLMAGNGAASGGRFAGIAPDAQIVSLKIAGKNGAADVSKVLAAIQWVVSFREQYGIDVLNLSLGTNSKVSPQYDPLNYAVQQAWKSGIAVVVAAGNTGGAQGTISKPGDDPYVITVGAVDDRETPALDDDRLPNFSARGPVTDGLLSWVKPDVVAPGARVISLRTAGSHIDEVAGPGVFAGTAFAGYRRGSGTSMSAAIVSGAVALLLERHPTWTPNRVKYALTATATKVAARDPNQVGAGLVRADLATLAGPGEANLAIPTQAMGTGSVDGSRGDVETGRCDPKTAECETCDTQANCPKVDGEQTAQGREFLSDRYAEGNWTESSWYTSQWAAPLLGQSWYGQSWYGQSWYGQSWYGQSWYGSTWYGNVDEKDEYGKPGKGGAWYGAWS